MLNEKLAYHFTSVDTAVNYILPNNTIMMNNFNKVNDPKESKDWPFNFYSMTSDEGRNFSKTLFSKARIYLNEHIFMTCFKVEEEEQYLDDYTQNRAFFDMRMWNEYGDKHKGVMLAFDFDLLESAYSDTGELMYSGPVRYTYDLTHIDWFQPIKKWEGGYFEFFSFNSISYTFFLWKYPMLLYPTNDPFAVNLDMLKKNELEEFLKWQCLIHNKSYFFHKLPYWRDETEYRWIAHTNEVQKNLFVDYKESLKAIIVGNDVSKIDLKKIQGLHLDVPIYRVLTSAWINTIHEVTDDDILILDTSFPLIPNSTDTFFQIRDCNGKSILAHFNCKTGDVSILPE